MGMKKLQRGFTLIEVMIVIAIIGILAGISYVSYSALTARAKNTAIINGVKDMMKVLELYKTKHGVYPLEKYANIRHNGVSSVDRAYPNDPDYKFEKDYPGPHEAANISLTLNKPETMIRLIESLKKTDSIPYSPRSNYSGFDTISKSDTSRVSPIPSSRPGGRSMWFNSTTELSQYREYVNYIKDIFGNIELPEVYTEKTTISGTGREKGALVGLEYHVRYKVKSGNRYIFLTYFLHGSNAECDAAAIKRLVHNDDNRTYCITLVSRENIGKNIRG